MSTSIDAPAPRVREAPPPRDAAEAAAPFAAEPAAEERARPLSGRHIGALDGIRGIAILFVLAFHFGRSAYDFGFEHPWVTASQIGWAGVDLFFVLSGFLITGILYDSRNGARYFRNFYARRALRICPLYYGALLVIVLMSAAWPGIGVWGSESPLWIAAYLTNVVMAVDGSQSVGILSHYWSLAIEEHFYLMWPLLVLLGSRRRLIAVAASLIAFSFALRIVLMLTGAVSDLGVYVLTPARFDALAVGAICALTIRGPGGVAGLLSKAWLAALACGAAFVFIALWYNTLDPHHPVVQTVGYLLLAVTFGAVIVIGLGWAPLGAVLSNAVLRWFGRYSYGIYVWHPIVNTLLFSAAVTSALGIEGSVGQALYLVAGFALSILVALASFHLWEQPFLRLKRYF